MGESQANHILNVYNVKIYTNTPDTCKNYIIKSGILVITLLLLTSIYTQGAENDSVKHQLKMQIADAAADYKRLSKAHLIVIDDIMLFPLEKGTAVSLFNFINKLYERTSFIITTNKAPKQWTQILDDEVLASALLDRFLYRCEVINLTRMGYRMTYNCLLSNQL